jgi:RNA polymerase sigma factor (sigma-70 family)
VFEYADGASRTGSGARENARETLVALVEAAREGDEEAWLQLHARLTPMLRRVAARHGLCEADVADVVQSTWSKCFENLARLRDPAALPGWLSTTCRREAVGTLRAHARCVPVDCHDGREWLAPLPAADTTPAGDPLAAVVDAETHALLRALLDELGQRERDLMTALIEDDVPYRLISARLDMPVGSIGPTRQRAIARLRRRARVLDIAA